MIPKLHSGSHNLYSSPNIIRVINSRGMKWSGHVACMEKMRKAYKSQENQNGRDHMRDIGTDGKIILRTIFQEQGIRMWSGLIWLRYSPVVGFCKHGDVPSGSIEGRESDQLTVTTASQGLCSMELVLSKSCTNNK
jgi:hypothetical protein